MELVKIGDYMATYARTGNDRNSNPIYILDFFKSYGANKGYYNDTIYAASQAKYKVDKNGNIKVQSYNILATINSILAKIDT